MGGCARTLGGTIAGRFKCEVKDQTRPDKTRQDQTRQDKTRPDQTPAFRCSARMQLVPSCGR
eukprot:11904079-Alexandrium_andersonii.AAC.1